MEVPADQRGHIWFLESLDRLNRAMQGTNDVELLMSSVLDVALEIFACDRAWLVYPCDPEAPSWRPVMEHTRPEFPGLFSLGRPHPMDADSAEVFRILRAASGALLFGPEHERPLPAAAREFGARSQMMMALYPKGDQPYVFGLHHCSVARAFTTQERRLFEETGYRLTDALTSVLMFRNLRESERRLEEAQRMAQLGYWDRNIEAGTVTLSAEACRFFGLPPEDRVLDIGTWDERWLPRIHPEDRPRIAAALAAALCGTSTYDVEYRVVQADGQTVILHSRGNLKRDEAGNPRRMFGTSMMVTELRRAEDALKASEARFRTFVEHATDGFFLLDEQLTVLDANRRAWESLGYSREELVGMRTPDFMVGEDCQVPDLPQRLLAGEIVTFETSQRRKDGTTFPVEIRSGHFQQGGGRYLSIVRDISDRRRAEQDRRDHVRFLEAMDRVNRVIQGTIDPERLMLDVLDVVLDVFQPDVAALSQFAGTPPVISVTVSSFRQGPGSTRRVASGVQVPVGEGDDAMYEALKGACGPLQFHRGAGDAVVDCALDRFQLQSTIAMRLVTKLQGSERVYHFSLAHRSAPRLWTPQEVRLFEEIGRRLGDAISAVATLQSLRQSEAHLAEAQRIAHVGHWEWEAGTDRFTCSPEAAAILGIPDEQRPTTFAEFRDWFPPGELLNGGSGIDFEHRLPRAGGEVRVVHIRGTARDDARRMFGTIQDVTEQRRAAEDLRAAETRFRSFIDHAGDALFVCDMETEKFVDMNRVACESLGYTREELLQMRPFDIDPGIRTEEVSRIRTQLNALQTITFETVHQRKDGTRFPVEVRIRPLGHLDHPLALALARDITDRKRAEEERERMRILEAERESAIANERNRLAGEIHDTLAQGLATIVMQLADAEARLGPSWLQAEKPLNTVRELAVESLAYARRSLNMLRPAVAASGLTRAVRHVAEGTRRHFGASINVAAEGESLALPAPVESALVSIAREALTNAARHAHAATIKVEIAFVDGNAVQLVVTDDGIGFDPDAVTPDSFGLVNMRERAARADIALTFVTEPGAGTAIVARWSA
ncbi:MAG TPA: PAS domain S-box protein [Polyangia bacterium]|nr:PAS domain S-box protein [Polyangia bacterium]